jgi:hypothetical protein
MYAPGEVVTRYCDLTWANIAAADGSRPPGVPNTRLRVIVTSRLITVVWAGAGGQVTAESRLDIDVTEAETAGTSFRGGVVGDWTVSLVAGCGCGGAKIKGYDPFPGVVLVPDPNSAQPVMPYGVPPLRWSRRSGS